MKAPIQGWWEPNSRIKHLNWLIQPQTPEAMLGPEASPSVVNAATSDASWSMHCTTRCIIWTMFSVAFCLFVGGTADDDPPRSNLARPSHRPGGRGNFDQTPAPLSNGPTRKVFPHNLGYPELI